MLLGLIFIALGVVLAVIWTTEFLFVLKGVLILSLLFWGVVALLIGLSQRKARRSYAAALRDEPGDDAEIAL